MDKLVRGFAGLFSSPTRENILLRAFAMSKVPLLAYCQPSIISMTDKAIIVKFPLTRRTKNHWNSMYFGALACGFDAAGGFLAVKVQETMQKKQRELDDNYFYNEIDSASLLFKDLTVDFKKRADGDVHFICGDGDKIKEGLEKTFKTGERVNIPVNVDAIVPSKNNTLAASAILTISLKKTTNNASENLVL